MCCRLFGSYFAATQSGGSGAADGLAGNSGEDLWKALLAECELAGELAAYEGGSEIAKGAKGQSIFDCVGDERAFDAVADLGLDSMAMAEARKGAADLLVGEVAVPDK